MILFLKVFSEALVEPMVETVVEPLGEPLKCSWLCVLVCGEELHYRVCLHDKQWSSAPGSTLLCSSSSLQHEGLGAACLLPPPVSSSVQ